MGSVEAHGHTNSPSTPSILLRRSPIRLSAGLLDGVRSRNQSGSGSNSFGPLCTPPWPWTLPKPCLPGNSFSYRCDVSSSVWARDAAGYNRSFFRNFPLGVWKTIEPALPVGWGSQLCAIATIIVEQQHRKPYLRFKPIASLRDEEIGHSSHAMGDH